jgi:hypothetical protein
MIRAMDYNDIYGKPIHAIRAIHCGAFGTL